jgi:uncharacterized membrane protein YoaK (UPF0700 family)
LRPEHGVGGQPFPAHFSLSLVFGVIGIFFGQQHHLAHGGKRCLHINVRAKMKIERTQLYLIGGVGMIVGAFFSAAKALGGTIALIYFFAATDFSSIERSHGENITHTFITGHITGAIHGVASFLILFFGARWLMSGPRIIDRWLDRGGSKPSE